MKTPVVVASVDETAREPNAQDLKWPSAMIEWYRCLRCSGIATSLEYEADNGKCPVCRKTPIKVCLGRMYPP